MVVAAVVVSALAGLALGLFLGAALRSGGSAPGQEATPEKHEFAGSDDLGVGMRSGLGPLAEAVDRIDQGVVLVDGRGVETYRNRAATRLSTARHGHALVESCLRRLLTEARSGEGRRETVELFGPPEELFLVSAHPFHDEHGMAVMALVEDRSDARRTETVRRDFVANISHELKTPVGALGLLAETVADENDPDTMRRLARRMVTEADRAARTIDDLLELSRIEFADDCDHVELDLRDVVAEAVSRIANAAEQSGVVVRASVPDDLVVHGDRRQLVSALFNLLDNAVKYSPGGGEVEVRAQVDPAGDQVVIVVEDHGIGIPRRSLGRIFERFYRVDRARARNTGGTGLGLAIVRHVVSNHGGEVAVESVEGRGSVFTLLLPCDASAGAPVAQERNGPVRDAGAPDSPAAAPPAAATEVGRP